MLAPCNVTTTRSNLPSRIRAIPWLMAADWPGILTSNNELKGSNVTIPQLLYVELLQ